MITTLWQRHAHGKSCGPMLPLHVALVQGVCGPTVNPRVFPFNKVSDSDERIALYLMGFSKAVAEHRSFSFLEREESSHFRCLYLGNSPPSSSILGLMGSTIIITIFTISILSIIALTSGCRLAVSYACRWLIPCYYLVPHNYTFRLCFISLCPCSLSWFVVSISLSSWGHVRNIIKVPYELAIRLLLFSYLVL